MNYHKKLKLIKAILIDIDGVLASNNIFLDEHADITRRFYFRDLWAVQTAMKKEIKVALITNFLTPDLVRVFKNIGIQEVYEPQNDRMQLLEDFCQKYNFSYDDIAYLGDDIEDLIPMENVGFSACPGDAVPEITDIVDYISYRNGGDGCVRDIIEKTLKVQEKWDIEEFNNWKNLK